MLDDDDSAPREKIRDADFLKYPRIIGGGGGWRIDENVIVGEIADFYFCFQSFDSADGVRANYRHSGMHFQRGEIFANERGAGCVIFDEGNVISATAEGFNAHRASSGEDIKEARVLNSQAQHVEKCFSQSVAGGAQRQTFKAFQNSAAVDSGDDAHISPVKIFSRRVRDGSVAASARAAIATPCATLRLARDR